MGAVQGCLEEADKDRRAKALEHKSAQARIKKLQEDVRTARSQLTQLRVRPFTTSDANSDGAMCFAVHRSH